MQTFFYHPNKVILSFPGMETEVGVNLLGYKEPRLVGKKTYFSWGKNFPYFSKQQRKKQTRKTTEYTSNGRINPIKASSPSKCHQYRKQFSKKVISGARDEMPGPVPPWCGLRALLGGQEDDHDDVEDVAHRVGGEDGEAGGGLGGAPGLRL